MAFSIKIIEDEVTPMLAHARESMPEDVTEEMKKIVTMMYEMARDVVPVRTGRLQKSIFMAIHDYFQFELGAGAPYALFVEYGTRYMSPRPFIRRGIQAYEQDLMKSILDGVMTSLKKGKTKRVTIQAFGKGRSV